MEFSLYLSRNVHCKGRAQLVQRRQNRKEMKTKQFLVAIMITISVRRRKIQLKIRAQSNAGHLNVVIGHPRSD